MELEWERIRQHASPSEEEVRRMLAPLGGVERWEVFPVGKANTNLKVTLESGETVVLRIYLREPSACAREVAIHALVKHSVPVPRVLHSNSEEGWLVLEYVDAKPLELQLDQAGEEVAESIGRTLAAIHRFEFPSSGFFGPDLSIETSIGEPLQAYVNHAHELLSSEFVTERLGSEVVAACHRLLDEYEPHFDLYRGPIRLVHSDYKAANLLVRKQDVVAVIDWEFAHAGCGLLDISILLRHSMPVSFLRGLERGYRVGHGFLSDRWRQTARVLDLVNLAEFLARAEAGKNLVADCVRLVGATLQEAR